MKKLFLTAFILALAAPSLAAPGATIPQIDPELLRALEAPPVAFPDTGALPSYMSSRPVQLTPAEKESLNLANEWADKYSKPTLMGNGKLVWMYGLSRPTVIGAPMQVCDIELQAGESVNEVLLGDSARWVLEVGNAGSSQGMVPHLFVKPVDTNLETTAVVTTDRRVYHLRLVSRVGKHTPYVGFLYPEDQFRPASLTASLSVRPKGQQFASGNQVGNTKPQPHQAAGRDLSQLHFDYQIKGDTTFKPHQVYDDGKQTFLRLPDGVQNMPVLLAKSGSADVMVNYRVQDTNFVVDGVFEHFVLLSGVGKNQQKIDIRRK